MTTVADCFAIRTLCGFELTFHTHNIKLCLRQRKVYIKERFGSYCARLSDLENALLQ